MRLMIFFIKVLSKLNEPKTIPQLIQNISPIHMKQERRAFFQTANESEKVGESNNLHAFNLEI